MSNKLPNAEVLEKSFNNLVQSLERIKSRRNTWTQTTKQLIVDTLEQIVAAHKFRWTVQIIDEEENSSTVNICCAATHSGIVEVIKNFDGSIKYKSLVKESSYIAFSQLYSGRIIIFTQMPYIKDKVFETPTRTLATFEPEEITTAIVVTHVITFLDLLSEWENMQKAFETERVAIGFKAKSN
jgi:hypothetical protein